MNKTERRHDLQQNELAAYLDKANTAIEPYSKQILGGILFVLAAVVAWSFYASERNADSSEATFDLIQNTNVRDVLPETLGTINTDFPETSAGKLAKLYEGLALVAEGTQEIYADRELATTALEDGIAKLKAVGENSDETLLKSRAYLGVALAQATLGDTSEAKAAYLKVIEANESEAMVENANARIESLGSQSNEDFAAWFKTADFNSDPSLPPTSALPGMPTFEMPATPSSGSESSVDGEANPLSGEAAPRNLEGGLGLPADVSTPATTDTPAPATTDTPAPAGTDAPAPAGTDAPAPAGTDAPAPAGTDAPAPAATDEPAPAATDAPAPAASDAPTETPASDDSATDK